MTNYLLELGVEEFPSRFIASTKEQLLTYALQGLKEAGLSVGEARIQATPRRFALWLDDIRTEDDKSEDIVRGPSKKAAYDAQGQPTRALEGFLRSKKLTLEDTFIENNGKDDYVFARIHKEAISPSVVLAQVIPNAIRKVSNPRSMRWGGKNLRFLRPIRWVLSLLDDQVLSFDLEGIPVGRITRGHRFLGKKEIEIATIASYETCLEENFVIIDESKRRDIILRGLNRLAREKGGVPLHNEELLEEVVFIVEYPTVFLGEVPPSYLSLPPEVIITPMMDHQRYFPVLDDQQHLLPYFLSVRNGNEKGLQNVIDGNCKVLIPRLEDAKFFYEQDLAKSFSSYVDHLDELVFHEALGTMLDKTKRLEKLALSMGEDFDCGPETRATLQRAAHLSKVDLVTKMVVEFTELQGTMGRIYATKAGEPEEVAQAIEEHYMPRQSGSDLPKTTAGKILSLADRIDTLAGLFAIGVSVTGSQDPFGLRRAVIGALDMIREGSLHFHLEDAFSDALLLYVEQQGLVFDYHDVISRVLEFFRGRLRTKFQEQGIRYDVADAVLATEGDDFLRIMLKAEAVQKWVEDNPEDSLFTSFIRITNMAQKAEKKEWSKEVLQAEDQEMFASLERKAEIETVLLQDHYGKALELLRDWMPMVNRYMDQTMILVEDEALRAARLGMLSEVYSVVSQILDPQRIVRETN